MSKELKFYISAREALLRGINALANAVKVTLGPKGNCVVINNGNKCKVTKDGVTVAKEIDLPDPFENTGAQLIKEAAIKTLNTVGDATTTSTVLAQSLSNLSLKYIKKGHNPVYIKRGIDKGCQLAIDYISHVTIPITDKDIKNIATISANNDVEIGNLIQEAFFKVGNDGIVNVENSSNTSTSIKVVNGMQFERGYLAQHFVTDEVKDCCVLENPYILITEQKIERMQDIVNILSPIAKENRSILLIAEDFDGEVLETLKFNKLQKTLKVCPVKAPSFGDYRKAVLEDIAIMTNGKSITYESNADLQDVTLTDLGTCNKVIVTRDTCTIFNGAGSKEKVDKRVMQIKQDLERIKNSSELTGSFLINFNKERIAKLTGGIAIIYVGGTTELEMSEKRDRIDDAIAATKAAIEEGIVLGGGLTYFNASKYVSRFKDENSDVTIGMKIVSEALIEPFNIIVKNAGYNPKKLYKNLTETVGFNANTEKFVNLYKDGIIDPAKAEKLALQNGCSVANLFLSTECIITQNNKAVLLNESY